MTMRTTKASTDRARILCLDLTKLAPKVSGNFQMAGADKS